MTLQGFLTLVGSAGVPHLRRKGETDAKKATKNDLDLLKLQNTLCLCASLIKQEKIVIIIIKKKKSQVL